MAKEPVTLSDPISLRLPVDLLADLDRIAEACERPRSWVIVRALRRYRSVEGADVLVAKAGMEQIERGEFVDMDDLIAELEEADRNHKAA